MADDAAATDDATTSSGGRTPAATGPQHQGAAESGDGRDAEIESAFQLTVEAGERRLERPTHSLLATGFVGGVDVSVGVFGALLVLSETGSQMLGALAFTIGFLALTLARSELFTENFLIPISAVVAHRKTVPSVLRLWTGTAVTNLIGGYVFAFLVMSAFPEFSDDAIELGQHFAELGIGWSSFAMAMVAGAIITIMTWMVEGTHSTGAKMVSAAAAGFLLAAGELNHCIVASLEMFHGLMVGAPYGYLDWLSVFVWAALGNAVGGIGLVTVLRLVQVGPPALREHRASGDAEE